MEQIPSEFVNYSISQKWFQSLLANISQTDIKISLQKWTTDSAAKNSTFRLWSFVLHHLLESLFELYIYLFELVIFQREMLLLIDSHQYFFLQTIEITAGCVRNIY